MGKHVFGARIWNYLQLLELFDVCIVGFAQWIYTIIAQTVSNGEQIAVHTAYLAASGENMVSGFLAIRYFQP